MAVGDGARDDAASAMTVPGYANYQRRLGRTELLQPMWDARAAGERRHALAPSRE